MKKLFYNYDRYTEVRGGVLVFLKKIFPLILLLFLLPFYSCETEEPAEEKASVSEIRILSLPKKTVYYEGEELDLTGMTVASVCDDGTIKLVTDYTSDPSSGTALTKDNTKVTVTYQNFTAEFAIQVLSKTAVLTGIQITELPKKTSYYEGEKLNLDGLVVKELYDDGSSVVVTDYTASPASNAVLTKDSTKVTVSHKGFNAQFSIQVLPKTASVTGITVLSLPKKTVYYEGEELDLTGMTVAAVCDDGTIKLVTDYTASPSSGTALTKDSTKVTVTYQTFTAEFAIQVLSKTAVLTGIQITELPQKTSYYEGEKLNLDGLVVKELYDDGSSVVVTDYTASPASNAVLTKDSTKVTVTHKGFNAQFSIQVLPKTASVTGITVLSLPKKTLYYEGEELDLTGMTVASVCDDGTIKLVTDYSATPSSGTTLTKDNTKVTVTYQSFTAEFAIQVLSKTAVLTGIQITELPKKTSYYEGEKLNLDGLVVKELYDDGSSVVVTDYTTSPSSDAVLTKDSTKVTVTHKGFNAQFSIQVLPKTASVTGITVLSLPKKTVYYEGEELDLTGMTVASVCDDGTIKLVTDYTTSPSSGTALTKDNTKVTVTYQNFTAEFAIQVLSKTAVLTGIQITELPKKNSYYEGEKLNLDGLVVKELYDDGSSVVVTDYTASPASDAVLTKDSTKVTVTHKGFNAQFSIQVLPKTASVTGITVLSLPKKTVYYEGEELDLTGMTVASVCDDGTIKLVTDYTASPLSGTALTKDNTKVTVTYQTFTAEFAIRVDLNTSSIISLTLPECEIPDVENFLTYADGCFTAKDGYASYTWWIDDTKTLLSGRECNVNTMNLSRGAHTLMLIAAEESSDVYSATAEFVIN